MKQKLNQLLVYTLSLLCATTTAWAVDPGKHISQYAHTAWRTREGVFDGAPILLTQTADGYLWVGTNTGLVRFDGVRFAPWNPPLGQRLLDPRVFSLAAAHDGSLWIGTGLGIDHLSRGELTHYPQLSGRIEYLVEDADGSVWLVRTQPTDSNGPLCRIKNDQVQCYGPKDGIPFPIAIQLQRGSSGELWIGGYDEVCRWASGIATTFFRRVTRRPETFASLKGLATAHDGSVWAAIDQSGPVFQLQHFEHGEWSKHNIPTKEVTNADITALFVDRDNMVWLGTSHHGIWRIHGSEIDHFDNSDGLSSDSVGRFYQDAEGTVWVVTSEGIDNFRDLRVTTFATREGLSAASASSLLARRDGTVWVGNFDALDVLNGKTVQGIHGLPGHNVTTLFEDHSGKVWAGLDNGLWVYDNHQFRTVRHADGTPLGIVFSIAEDIHHAIWVRAGPNLDRIENFNLTSEVTSPQISGAYIMAADPRGGLFLGRVNGDLLHYEDGKTRVFAASGVDGSRQVRDLLVESDASVWGTTLDGVFLSRNGERRNLTTRNGLPCDGIFALVKDDQNSLWLYARCGLIAIERSQLDAWWDHPENTVQFKLFDALDGVSPGLTSLKPQAVKSLDGLLWFVNGRYVQMIDPRLPRLNTLAPPVHIEEIVADHQHYSYQDGLRLPPLTRDLEIEYAALSFVGPEKVRFRYKLEGRDQDWQDPGKRRQAFYTDLGPGNYTFKVIASNNEDVWNDWGSTFIFSVAPAWFQTAWFRLLCIVGGIFTIWMIYQQRLRRVAKDLGARFDERLAERTRIARDMHDTFLQTLQGSKLVADDALEHSNDPVRTQHALEKLSRWLSQATKEGRDALHSLRTSTIETNDLAAALERAVDDCRRETSKEVVFSVTGVAREMHPLVRDEIYRIGYEAIRNACVHSSGSHVDVALNYAEDLSLRVHDNGRGIDPAVIEKGKTGHFGLQGMRERAARIGGQLKVVSSANSGTEIKLIVPARIVFHKTHPHEPLNSIFKV